MRAFLIVLFALLTGVTSASEENYLMPIPEDVTVSDAMLITSKAAVRRKWSVSESGENQLQLKLKHRDYTAVLDLSFSKGKISYSDSTTYLDRWAASRAVHDGAPPVEPVPKPVPAKWLANLKKDIRKGLADAPRSSSASGRSSEDDVVTKLEKLKKLRDKKLITEAEYEAKKAEILSEY